MTGLLVLLVLVGALGGFVYCAGSEAEGKWTPTEKHLTEGNSEGPWTRKRGYRYPPFYGYEERPRSEFSEEEQRFIEEFWLPKRWEPACDRAGLVRIIPGDEEKGIPEQRKYPRLNAVGVFPDSVQVSIESFGSGFSPADIEAKVDYLVMHISNAGGMSEITTETDRTFCRIKLHSRSPLDRSFSADDLFGKTTRSTRQATTDDFLREMGGDQE